MTFYVFPLIVPSKPVTNRFTISVFVIKALAIKSLVILVLLASTLLSGCGESRGQAALENYQNRLLNVFTQFDLKRIEKPEGVVVEVIRLPESILVSQPLRTDEGVIDLLDFLSLYGCRLQEVIAWTNSSLGKVAYASQRLLNAIRFIELAPECIAHLRSEDKPELAQAVQNELTYKQAQLGWLYASAVIAGSEYRAFWRIPVALDNYPEDLNYISIRSLERLSTLYGLWLEGDFQDFDKLEALLKELATGDGGALLKSYALLRAEMESANTLLRRVLDSPVICRKSSSYSDKVLSNVVQKFFIGDVQVWAAELNRRKFEMLAVLQPLERQLLPYLSEAYQQWISARDDLLQQADQSLRNHVKVLQVLMSGEKLEQWCSRGS